MNSPMGVRQTVIDSPLGVARGGVLPWLSGGVPSANCVAAYQPKGAASLAASYINLTGNATYNAAPGVKPTWDAVNGWKFDGTQHLTTGVVPITAAWSVIMRVSNSSSNGLHLTGAYNPATTRYFLMTNNVAGNIVFYASGGGGSNASPCLSGGAGVICMAGTRAYRNGIDEGVTLGGGSGAAVLALYIGASNLNDSPFQRSVVYVQAWYAYDISLTPQQAAAISAAMAAL